jgi:hypothetical protein
MADSGWRIAEARWNRAAAGFANRYPLSAIRHGLTPPHQIP